jgi:Lon protease-like protein
VFEPRYRELTAHCLAGDREFGVVLIERGHEVGGGDTRFDVGTVARIVQAGQLDDGRWMLVNVGTERLRVLEWLDDDPFPRAHVERLGDVTSAASSDGASDVAALLRRVLALHVELGDLTAPVDVQLDDDPALASYQAAALAPVGPLDAQRLLEIGDAGERLARLQELLTEDLAVLELRLSER